MPGTLTTDHTACGPDCVYLDGVCYCYHGEIVSASFGDPVLDDLELPY